MERLTEKDAYWYGEEFWTNAKEPDDETIDEVYMKLKEYEDAEEQGLLKKFPCKIGDVVTIILSSIIPHKKIVKQAMVSEFKVSKDVYLVVKPLERPDVPYEYCIDDWGENIFPTLDAALANMECE